MQEYLLRVAPTHAASATQLRGSDAAALARSRTDSHFSAQLPAEEGAVALRGEGAPAVGALTAAEPPGAHPADGVLSVRAASPTRAFEDDAASELMAAYTAEGRAHVNPVTGQPVRWGDTWMQERGGGIGTGRALRLRGGEAGQLATAASSPDRAALLAFYDACNGPRWGVSRNWGVAEPCASAWHGVRCAGGRVVELQLNLNNVACSGGLSLRELGGCSELRVLDLSDNHMGGPLPGDDLALLPHLQSLVLSGNRFTGPLPEQLGSLGELRHLDCSASGLSGPLPPALGRLARLEVLYLGEDGLGQRNALQGPLPGAWAGMLGLRRLSLAGNRVGGSLPAWLAGLTALEELNLRDARLGGTLPAWLASLPRLRVLELGGNQLSGELPPLGASLLHLDLSRNGLDGGLEGAKLERLTLLRTLRLAHNGLDGVLPPQLAALAQLQELDLSHNDLGGELPPWLARMPQLRVLRLGGNRLSGPWPGWLLAAPRLSRLHLDGNRLGGSLEGTPWERAGGLVELHASGNSLEGSLPPALGLLTRLASLQLAHNRLRGSLPAQLGAMRQLARLDVSHNALSGTLPPELASLGELAELHAHSNALSGTLPAALGELPLLRSLLLSGNALTGPLPAWLATAPSLGVADVSANRLSGRLPPAWWVTGGAGGVPPLALRRGFLEREQRHLNAGANPLLCPLPRWAPAVAATCRWVEVQAAVALRGGALLRLSWSGVDLSAVAGLGCLFGTDARWAPALESAAAHLTCALGGGEARSVRLALGGGAVSQFATPVREELDHASSEL